MSCLKKFTVKRKMKYFCLVVTYNFTSLTKDSENNFQDFIIFLQYLIGFATVKP